MKPPLQQRHLKSKQRDKTKERVEREGGQTMSSSWLNETWHFPLYILTQSSWFDISTVIKLWLC